MFRTATRFVAATDKRPAFCQATGSFVTNPKTGKTANFLATFPANWNGKYLQLGCSGHCGQFYVSDPAMPPITVTAQGYAGQIIEKGYATFATDEGHEGMDSASWAVKKDGSIDQDAIEGPQRGNALRSGREQIGDDELRIRREPSPAERQWKAGLALVEAVPAVDPTGGALFAMSDAEGKSLGLLAAFAFIPLYFALAGLTRVTLERTRDDAARSLGRAVAGRARLGQPLQADGDHVRWNTTPKPPSG